ncbi:MAG: nucleotidyltransferase domain-containing protein [Candidatus Aenigmatarchaeota archaeon]
MKSFLQVLSEIERENKKYFKNYIKYAKIAKVVSKRELGGVKVFVFGSVIEGLATPASDIDLLIVSKNMPSLMNERAKLSVKILKKIGLLSSFEIHLVNEREFEWYKRFIKRKIEI